MAQAQHSNVLSQCYTTQLSRHPKDFLILLLSIWCELAKCPLSCIKLMPMVCPEKFSTKTKGFPIPWEGFPILWEGFPIPREGFPIPREGFPLPLHYANLCFTFACKDSEIYRLKRTSHLYNLHSAIKQLY